MSNKQDGIQIGASPQQAQKPDPDADVKASLQTIKNKFIVMSGKGGVGKTSTSVNLALALSQKGHKVGLMDVDIHGPDIPRMLGLSGMMGVNSDRKLTPLVFSKNLKVVSIEALTPDKDTAIIWRGPMKHSVIRQFVADVDWGELDFLIIDSPPGTGDEPLSVAQTIRDAKAIIVTTPQEIALADVRKSISFCQTISMDIFGLIENMSGFTCPHCHQNIDLFGSGGGERTSTVMGLNFLGRVPFDPRQVVCGDAGKCILDVHGDSDISRAFAEIADKLSQTLKG